MGRCYAEISDQAVAFIHTMLDLHCDMDVAEHLPGMFVLAAHHDARVRGFVQTHMLAGLPKLTSHEDVDGIPNFWSLLDTWVRPASSSPAPSAIAVFKAK